MYEVYSKYLTNISLCVLLYVLHNHNFQNFRFQKCMAEPRCAEEAADASEVICDYKWERGRAEIDYKAGCEEVRHKSIGGKNRG